MEMHTQLDDAAAADDDDIWEIWIDRADWRLKQWATRQRPSSPAGLYYGIAFYTSLWAIMSPPSRSIDCADLVGKIIFVFPSLFSPMVFGQQQLQIRRWKPNKTKKQFSQLCKLSWMRMPSIAAKIVGLNCITSRNGYEEVEELEKIKFQLISLLDKIALSQLTAQP